MRSSSSSIFAIGLLLASAAATAQEAVTEADFLASLGRDHPALRAVGEDLARAEAMRRRAVTLSNPRLEFARERPDDTPRQDTWTLAWAPPLDGRRGLARDAAEAAVLAARERTAAERARLRRDLRKAYADWSLAHERRQVLAGHVALVDDLSQKARHRARLGEESGLAARRMELAASEVSAQLVAARTDHLRAEALALGWRPDLAGRLPAIPQPPPPPASVDPAQRPEIRALQLEARQAALEARLAGRFWGAPELQAGWQRLDDRGSTQAGPVLGFAWAVPLFDRNQADRVEAKRRQEIAEARTALASSRAEREAKAAIEAYALAAAAADESARGIGDADRLVEAATASFGSGEATVTDLLDTLRSVREARLRALDLLSAALEAHRELELWIPGTSDGGAR